MKNTAGMILIASLGLHPLQLAAQSSGRLFHTQEERARLDAEKHGKQPGSAVHYQGIVQRSQGPTTVWINGKPATGKPPPGLRVGEQHADHEQGKAQDLLQGGQIIIHPSRHR